MDLLVTGAAGFIGSNFVYHYLRKYPDDRIIAFDKLTYAGNLINLDNLNDEEKSRFVFIKGDICDQDAVEKVFSNFGIDKVINFAAESHVDRSLHNPQIFLTTNILGTHTLLDAAKEFWYENGQWARESKFLQISTDEVYGSLGPTGFFTEDSPIKPSSPYSASKASADLLVESYQETYGFPACISRCSNNYGPYQFPEKLIPLMINNARNHKPLPLYGDGLQVRDWIDVNDHCHAIDLVLQNGSIGDVYNIGGGNERTNISIVKEIIALLSRTLSDESINDDLIQFVKDRPGHDRRYAINSSKIRDELKWKPQVTIDEGLASTVNWYLENEDWVDKIVSGEYLRFYELNYGKR